MKCKLLFLKLRWKEKPMKINKTNSLKFISKQCLLFDYSNKIEKKKEKNL